MLRLLVNEYKQKYKNRKFALPFALRSYYLMPKFRVEILIKRAIQTKSKSVRRRISNKLLLKYNVDLGINCKIGSNLKIEHYSGIVIGSEVVIGDSCTLYHQITLGQKNNKYPVIGNNVIIYPGAKVLGDVRIGNNAVIAANSVVLKDVSDGEIVAGIPAKQIGKVCL